MASSSCGASCAKPSKDVFRTQPYIQDGAFMKIVNAEVFSQKSSILDVWLESKYASALCSQKSVRVQLLNKLSEICINLSEIQNEFVTLLIKKVIF